MWPFRKKEEAKPKALAPGDCECGHMRCAHDAAKGRCRVWCPPNEDYPKGGDCACVVYIRDHRPDDDDNDPEDEPTPSPEELERMVGGGR